MMYSLKCRADQTLATIFAAELLRARLSGLASEASSSVCEGTRLMGELKSASFMLECSLCGPEDGTGLIGVPTAPAEVQSGEVSDWKHPSASTCATLTASS